MNSKPDAIVFFDLDGTLLTSNVDVAQSSIDAMHALRSNNIMPIIATGRTACEVAHIMQQTDINSIVAMNGQAVLYDGEEVFVNNIDPNLVDKLYQFSKEVGIPLSFYNYQVMRISARGEPAIKFYNFVKESLPPVDDTIYLHTAIQMVLLLCETGESQYRDKFPELTFIRNAPYCVDVFNHGGSKGNGIKKLLTNRNFTDVPTYAFGDGMNDMEMFTTVDHPISMANGVDALKAQAEYITATNDSDGIVKGLRHFGLI
ncbi:Cof-type HAD-IIB family hydrolase [Orbaceae bacterium ESL0721]|nr:Cof-type HAD-IIB family hydrolase [Orbaceae bacterium ESL0721]